MKKDVIYIDIEDDITAVIEKLKNSPEKIVALVPPKGNAVLQSVVNLKLLKRAAATVAKQPVLVTNNPALTALAGGLELYVAKNLQSKPVLASSLAEDMPEDEDLEVSDELVAPETGASTIPLADNTADESEVELTSAELAALDTPNASDNPTPVAAAKKSANKGKKIPNFDNFRKKLLIGGAIVLLLAIGLLFVFGRAKANIVVRAATTPVDVALQAAFNANSATSDPETYNLKAVAQEKKQTLSQSFTATGQKDIGDKAKGRMRVTRSSVSSTPIAVPAGSRFTANGLTFVSTESAQLAGTSIGPGGLIQDSKVVNVEAAESGDKYNLSARGYQSSVAGVNAQGSQMSGGTTEVVKVVSQADVDKAQAQLNQQDTNGPRNELKEAFDKDTIALDDSLVVSLQNTRSEPAVGEQANEARLTAEATYSMLGVPKADLGSALDAFVVTQMSNKDQQRVYDNGLNDLKFEKVSADAKTAVYKLTTSAQYGPQFDTEKLKAEVAGKKFGEARAYLQDLPGVKGVDINLSPFWARKLPNTGRVNIKLDVDKSNSD